MTRQQKRRAAFLEAHYALSSGLHNDGRPAYGDNPGALAVNLPRRNRRRIAKQLMKRNWRAGGD